MKLNHDIVNANEAAPIQKILSDTKPRPMSNSASTPPSMSLLFLNTLEVGGTSAPNERLVDQKKLRP